MAALLSAAIQAGSARGLQRRPAGCRLRAGSLGGPRATGAAVDAAERRLRGGRLGRPWAPGPAARLARPAAGGRRPAAMIEAPVRPRDDVRPGGAEERIRERIRVAAFCLLLTVLPFVTAPGNIISDTKLDLAVNPARFLARALTLWDPHPVRPAAEPGRRLPVPDGPVLPARQAGRPAAVGHPAALDRRGRWRPRSSARSAGGPAWGSARPGPGSPRAPPTRSRRSG